jgi:phosphoesterase RecJ-like protein
VPAARDGAAAAQGARRRRPLPADAGPDPAQADEWRKIVEAVAGCRAPLLVLHVRPDGDSVGSSLAVAHCLRGLGKRPTVVAPEPVPPSLAFLDPEGECVPPEKAEGPFDLGLFLDCADLERTGAARALVRSLPRLVNIDHHPSNARYGDLNYVDPGAAACAEIALRLLDALGCTLDARAATQLYAALATDTGSFRFPSTTPATLHMAARLRAAGADLERISREVWENRSLPTLRLLGLALQTLAVDEGGELAWITVSPEHLAAAGADPASTEGLVDYPRSLRGVEVAVLFTWTGGDEVRVSLRSKERVDVSALAQRFGGGGHARAAGCVLHGPLPEVQQRVLAAARAALAAGRGCANGRGPSPAGGEGGSVR